MCVLRVGSPLKNCVDGSRAVVAPRGFDAVRKAFPGRRENLTPMSTCATEPATWTGEFSMAMGCRPSVWS